jgi:hypothetical protein
LALAAVALQLAASSPAAAAAANTPAGPTPGQRAGRPAYGDGGWRCPPGFVWRNAGRQDWLCVDPFEAERIARENQQAPNNWIDTPDGSRSCRSGLVPRGAFHNDPVCVDPVRRALVREMNLALYNVH